MGLLSDVFEKEWMKSSVVFPREGLFANSLFTGFPGPFRTRPKDVLWTNLNYVERFVQFVRLISISNSAVNCMYILRLCGGG